MSVSNNANTYLPGVIQIPSSLTIVAATNNNPMVITVSVNSVTESNTYIPGQCINLNIPIQYGMWQANGLSPVILEVDGNDITVDIDSTFFDPFVVPASNYQVATVSPNGSRNLQFSNQTDQISFQSLNNTGN